MTFRTFYERGPGIAGPILLVHGGAGPRLNPVSATNDSRYREGLGAALAAGSAALMAGASALDAVCAAVVELENNEMFNAGRGAALTAAGTAELDASVMTGDGRAGAIAASKHIKNPVLGARAVHDRTSHVLIVDPDDEFVGDQALEDVSAGYFITAQRQEQLREVLAKRVPQERHGTVGAVALDQAGHVACATSTGGMVAQAVGRVGDTPLIGSGSFARDNEVAVSCTGDGEAYIQGCVAHDIAARIRYRGSDLRSAVADTYAAELEPVDATGGTIAITPAGAAVIALNSDGMFAGRWDGQDTEVFI